MKLLFLSFLLPFFIPAENYCKQFHKGKFEYETSPGNSITIIRNKNKEIHRSKGFASQFDIKWISDCSYILYNTKILRRKNDESDIVAQGMDISKDTTLCEIVEINGTTHKLVCHFDKNNLYTEQLTFIKKK